MTRPELPTQLVETRVVAVVRGRRPEHLEAAVETMVAGGLRCLELTLNTPSALEVLHKVSARHAAALWGAGTVLTAVQVHAAADAGATFVVAPNLDERVGEACLALGLSWYPGASTPTEIKRAWDLGACAVKVFPAASAGGPSYLREVAGPLDDIRLLPTGGVTLQSIPDYLAAGAVAVGLGGALVGDVLSTGDTATLRQRVSTALDAARPRGDA